MADARVSVTLTARDRARGALTGFDRQLKTIGRSAFNLRGIFAGFATALAARRLVRGAQEVLEAFGKQEEAVTSLNAALQATGRFSAEASRAIQAQAAAIQQVTTVGDEALIAATGSLATLADQLQADQLAEAQRAIVGIADTFLKGDVNNAALVLGKTLGSTTNALARYGIQVDVNASQSEKLRQILGQTGTFFAVAQAKATTLTGRLSQLANAWGDFKERLGELLEESGAVKEFVESLTEAVTNFTTILSGSGKEIRRAFLLLGIAAASAFSAGFYTVLEQIGLLLSKIPLLGAFSRVVGISKLLGDFIRASMDEAVASARGALIELDELAKQIAARVGSDGGGSGTDGTLPGAVRLPEITITGKRVKAANEELQGETQERLAAAAESFQNNAALVVASLGSMAEAAVRNTQITVSAVVNMLAQIVSSLPGVGPLAGAIVTAGAGIFGAIFGGGPRRPTPVSVVEVKPAVAQEFPLRVTNIVQIASTGELVDMVEYELLRRERVDRINRIPGGLLISGSAFRSG